jgi:hypothetical protein
VFFSTCTVDQKIRFTLQLTLTIISIIIIVNQIKPIFSMAKDIPSPMKSRFTLHNSFE